MGAWNWIEKDQKNWTKSTNKGKRINYAKRFKIKIIIIKRMRIKIKIKNKLDGN